MDGSVTISMPRETQKSLMAYTEESPWGALTYHLWLSSVPTNKTATYRRIIEGR